MALKIKLARPTGKHPWSIAGAAHCARDRCGLSRWCSLVASAAIYYFKYQGIVDERLKQPLFANTAKIYAAPREVRPGQKLSVHLIAEELREAGYTADGAPQDFAAGHLQREAYSDHRASRPAVLSRAGQRDHPCQRRRGEFDHATITASRCPAMNWSRC